MAIIPFYHGYRQPSVRRPHLVSANSSDPVSAHRPEEEIFPDRDLCFGVFVS